ncbi:hypothetical protein [Streptacidiphilus melanogenes]|uniref:hypothetical protein n=1 Tax=Streptacidiphilus melanogenes TaxID=411235 RepID=UPI0013923D5C|nr:hypothetical protein [Streptacidiphilus melanogenes]
MPVAELAGGEPVAGDADPLVLVLLQAAAANPMAASAIAPVVRCLTVFAPLDEWTGVPVGPEPVKGSTPRRTHGFNLFLVFRPDFDRSLVLHTF